MLTLHRICLVAIAALLLSVSGAPAGTSLPPFDANNVPNPPDYSTPGGWLVQPTSPLKHAVDVFWVYPTVLHDDTHWLMETSSSDMRTTSANTLIRQASVFDDAANIFAPMYRQMNMRVLSLGKDTQDQLIQYGTDDVWRALQYYLEHINTDRPFILASHSQGSDILVQLLIKYWGAIGVENRLVAGYLIGWSITAQDLKANPAIKMCNDADQTGCFISYNTVAKGRQKVAPTIRPGAVVTNPLTWRTDGAFAPAALNLGSRFFDGHNKITDRSHFTSAQVIDSGLVVQPADPALVHLDSSTFPQGVYHQFDYSLFYENLRQNSAHRIQVFQSKQ